MFQRLLNIFRQRRIEDEIQEEMRSHLTFLEEEELASGAPAAAARRAAQLRFGNRALFHDRTRDASLAIWLDDLLRDSRFALRQLLRAPLFAAATVLLLGLGIGVNAAIFTVIRSVILRPLPVSEPERLVSVLESTRRFETPVSWPDFLDLQEANPFFASSGAVGSANFIFRGSADALNLKGARATLGYFTALAVKPLAGRLFDDSDSVEGANPVALIREDFWRAALDADPAILHRTVLLNGRATQIIGVLPGSFRFPATDSVVWTPLIPEGPEKNRGYHSFAMVGRLKPTVSIEQAQTGEEAVMRRLDHDYPDQNANRHAKIVSLQDADLDKTFRGRLYVLQIAALALFLMACANVSSLLLARQSVRRREFEVRLALGASRARQIRQHLTESLILTGAGCIAAAGLAAAGVRFLVWLYGDDMPRAAEISPDWKLVASVIAAALAGAIAMGLATVLNSRADASALAAGAAGRVSSGRRGVFTRKLLVVFQLACAVTLLGATGGVLQSFWRLLNTDVGFDRSRLIAMRVSLPSAKFNTGAAIGAQFETLAASVRSLPGVRQAAAINMLPVAEWGFNGDVNVEGLPAEHRGFFAEYRWVSQDYFRAIAIPILRGRAFLPEEISGARKAAIINQTMAHKLWGDADPIGAHINMFSPEWITVVGIVRDVRQSGVGAPPSPEVFLPASGFIATMPNWSLLVRTDLAADSIVPAVRAAIRAAQPDAAIDRVRSMEDVIADSVSGQRIVAMLLTAFAILALTLAAIGLYSVLTYTVAARVPELAIRLALGSTARGILALVTREGAALLAIGLAIGLAALLPLRSVIAKFVFDAGPLSAPLCLAVASVLFLIGAAAIALPAWRATRIDPIRFLRGD